MRRFSAAVFVLLLAQAGASAAADASHAPDTDNIVAAAMAMNTEVSTWNSWRHECAAYRPDDARGLSAIFLKWTEDNRAPILAMRAYGEGEMHDIKAFDLTEKTSDPGQVARASKAGSVAPGDLCLTTFQKLLAGEFAFSRTHPLATKVLGQYLAAHPLSTQSLRAYDNPVGCQKAGVNKSYTLDILIPVCRCMWEATNSSFTAAEWDQYESSVHAGKPKYPKEELVMPKVRACAVLLNKP